MAKLRGAKKAAFLRRMAKGRAKARRVVGGKRRRSRRVVTLSSVTRRPRRNVKRKAVRGRRIRAYRNPLTLLANPSFSGGGARYPRASISGFIDTPSVKRKRRKRKGTSTMARKRKRRSGKRRARRTRAHRRTHARRRPIRRRRRARRSGGSRIARVRRGTRLIYINPRKRRRRRSRRRNGSFGIKGALSRAFVPYAAGFVTSMGVAILDSTLTRYPMGRNLVKVGAAVLVTAVFGRKYPRVATSAVAAIAASQGYALGTRLGGGGIFHSTAEAVKEVSNASKTNPAMGALLDGGVGALLNGPENIDSMVSNYETALNNMAGDDDE